MRPQTASLPKRLEVKVAQVARRLKKPRRLVLQEAIEEYSARHDPDAVTAAMNRVADAVDTHPDPGLASAARNILERSQW
jgi:ribosomal protein S7